MTEREVSFRRLLETLDTQNEHLSNLSIVLSKLSAVLSNGAGGVGGGGEVSQNGSKKCRRRRRNSSYSPEFETFWAAYPRKEGKGRAWNYWERDNLAVYLSAMLSKIEVYSRTEQWQKDNGVYIPHPASWLNARCWEDEPLVAKTGQHAPKCAICERGLTEPESIAVGLCREHRDGAKGE